MNKKFLSAVLFGALMVGSSVTFTGCIDNDEPAGIENLRGAKAELLKAKAAVENADAAFRMAQVANQELLNKAQEIANQILAYEAAIKQAESAKEVADLENAKALAAEKFKADMLDAQTKTAYAQKAYEDAMKAIEASKLVLSEGEMAVLEAAQERVANKAGLLSQAHADLNAAATALNTAFETTDPQVTQAGLELEIAKAQVTLDAAKVAVANVEEIIAKNIDSYEGWEAEMKDLKNKIAEQDTIIAQANIDKVKIQQSQAGKDAAQAVDDTTDALDKAKENRDNVYAGQTVDGISYTFKLAKYSKDVTSNKALVEVLDATNAAAATPTTTYNAGKFSYAEESYNQNDYKANGSTVEKALKEMIALVDAVPGRAAEDLAWVNNLLTIEGKNLSDATTAYNTAIAAWQKAVQDFKDDKNYTSAQYGVAVSNATGLLNDILSGTFTSSALQDAAYDNYMAFRKEMTDNGQSISPLSGVNNYATLKAAVDAAGAITSFLPTGYTPVDARATLVAKSQAAFGNLYMFGGNPRLTLPTDAEVAAEQAKIAAGTATYANYGAIGAVWEPQANIKYYNQIIAQADAIKALKADLVAQQAAVAAEISANTAIVKAFDTIVADAETAKKNAEDADEALYADVNDVLKIANATKASYTAIKDAIEAEMAGIASGATTVADVKKALAEQLNSAKEGVVAAEAALKDAQTKLEHFNAGKYNKQYEIEVLTAELERAQSRFDEAQKVYNKALAELNAVIVKLTASAE